MYLLVFYFSFSLCIYIDSFGVEFSDDKTQLLQGHSQLEAYTIPSFVTHIISQDSIINAFGSCKLLTSITFESNSKLVYIGPFSFYNTKITSLDLSQCTKLAKISYSAFKGCSSLSSITLNEGLIILEPGVFYKTNISSISIPSTVSTISYTNEQGGPFSYCNNLKTVDFCSNGSLKIIEGRTFAFSGITSVIIPHTVISLSIAFMGCPLQSIVVDNGNSFYKSINNSVMDYAEKNLVFTTNNVINYSLQSTITRILYGAFRNSQLEYIMLHDNLITLDPSAFMESNLKEIIIPRSVRTIGYHCFWKCSFLSSVEFLGNNITIFASNSYSYCSNLQQIIIPNGVKTIEVNCFYGCSTIDLIEIPDTVTAIGGGAFYNINNTAILRFTGNASMRIINNIIYNPTCTIASTYIGPNTGDSVSIVSQCQILSDSLFSNKNIISVTFPSNSSLTTIMDYSFSSSNIQSISLPPSVTQISIFAFSYCTSLVSIELSLSLLTIGESSFRSCTKLTSISYPSNLNLIDTNAFFGCTKLSSVTFLADCTLTRIGQSAFRSTGILSIIFPSSLNDIGYYAFAESRLINLTFTEGSLLQIIPSYSFYKCTYLISVIFSTTLQSIGTNAFELCISISQISINSGLRNISKWAFKGCTSLTTVSIPDNSQLDSILGLAFDGCTNLVNFSVSVFNPRFSSAEGVLFNKNQSIIVVYLPASLRKIFEIPFSVTTINAYCFQNCQNLETIILPDGLKGIGFCAFDQCTKLSHITIPNTVESIGSFAFRDCSQLKCGSVSFYHEQYSLLISSGMSATALSVCQSCFYSLNSCMSAKLSIYLISFLPLVLIQSSLNLGLTLENL